MSIHKGHRERMRKQLKTSGMDSLSDVQVLEVLLYYAAPRGDTNPAAHALLSRFGTLDGVFSAPESELKKVSGVGDAAAQLIRLVPQVARRCLMSRSAQIEILDTTSKCGQYLLPYFLGAREEVVYLLCLDAKCKALDCRMLIQSRRRERRRPSAVAQGRGGRAWPANATCVVLARTTIPQRPRAAQPRGCGRPRWLLPRGARGGGDSCWPTTSSWRTTTLSLMARRAAFFRT